MNREKCVIFERYVGPGRLRRVLLLAGRVLHRREDVFTLHLEDEDLVREREDVEDEGLELDPVVRGRLHRLAWFLSNAGISFLSFSSATQVL